MKKNKTISVKICVCIICAFSLLLSADRSKITVSAREAGEINTETAANSSEAETDTALRDSVTISLAGDCSLGKLSIHSYAGAFYEMYDLYGASCFLWITVCSANWTPSPHFRRSISPTSATTPSETTQGIRIGFYIIYSLGNFRFGGNKKPKDKSCCHYSVYERLQSALWRHDRCGGGVSAAFSE